MVGRMRANTFKRWEEHLRACFSRGVRDFRDGLEFEDCPYNGKGVDLQRKAQWQEGFRAAEKNRKSSDPVAACFRSSVWRVNQNTKTGESIVDTVRKSMDVRKFSCDAVWNGSKYNRTEIAFVSPKGKGVRCWAYTPQTGGTFMSMAGAIRSIKRMWKTEWHGYNGNVLFVVYEERFLGGPSDGTVQISVDVYDGI